MEFYTSPWYTMTKIKKTTKERQEEYMQVLYKSTRGKGETVTASMAILKGLSEDGGLFVPTSIPKLDVPVEKLAQMTYQETAYEVMSRFLTDFTEEELKNCIANAYDEKFDTTEIAPLHEADGAYYLELFHGSTIAFKDMALSILPHLMTTAARKNQVKNDIVILTATSGDTGKAALAGFADVPGTRIIEARCKPDPGEADGNSEGCQHSRCRYHRKLRRRTDRSQEDVQR